MTALSWLAGAAGAARGERPPFALAYHGVGPIDSGGDPHGLMMPVRRFEAHLDTIAARGYRLVRLSELWEAIEQDRADGLGAITIDDGLADSMATVAAILTGRGLTATVYIPTGLLGRPHPHLPSGQPIVDAGEVRGLAAAGFEIGGHTVDHPDLRLLPQAEALEQMRRSREALEDLLSEPVTSMAYPFGSFDERTIAAAGEAGYRTACGCSGIAPWRALALPREPAYPTTSPFRLRVKMAGLYGPAHAASRLRNRLRRTRGEPTTTREDRRAVVREPSDS